MLLENTGRFSVITKDDARAGIDSMVMTDEIVAEQRA